MPDRGWLGYSRRWFASEQTRADPVEVLTVGADESDAASLNAAGLTAAAVAAEFCTVSLQVPAGAGFDVFAELVVVSQVTTLLWAVRPFDVGPSQDVVSQATMRGVGVTPVVVSAATEATALSGATMPSAPSSFFAFESPGILIAEGFRLSIGNATVNQGFTVGFFFREAH